MRKNDSFTYCNLLILCIWPRVINKVKVEIISEVKVEAEIKMIKIIKNYQSIIKGHQNL